MRIEVRTHSLVRPFGVMGKLAGGGRAPRDAQKVTGCLISISCFLMRRSCVFLRGVSAAAGLLRPGRVRGFLAGNGVYQLRHKGQQQEDRAGGYRDVHSGRLLDIVRKVPELRDGEHGDAYDIFIVYEHTVLGGVRVALGAKADDGGVGLVLYDAGDTVGRHGVLIDHEAYHVALLQGEGVGLLDVYYRACMIGRLHRAGEHGVHPQAEKPDANEQQRQQHRRRHEHR